MRALEVPGRWMLSWIGRIMATTDKLDTGTVDRICNVTATFLMAAMIALVVACVLMAAG